MRTKVTVQVWDIKRTVMKKCILKKGQIFEIDTMDEMCK
jgi:hypothetical protein